MLLAVYYRVMEDLGSLESTESTQSHRVIALGNSYASFETFHVLHNSIVYAEASTLKHAKVRLVT